MVLTCPACKKRYYVKSADIQESRPVRCSSCQSIWVAEPLTKPEQAVLTLGKSVMAPYGAFARKTALARINLEEKTRKKAGLGKNKVAFFFFVAGMILLLTPNLSQLLKNTQTVNFFLAYFQKKLAPTYPTSDHASPAQAIEKKNIKLANTPSIRLRQISAIHIQENKKVQLKGRLQNTGQRMLSVVPLKITLITCCAENHRFCQIKNFAALKKNKKLKNQEKMIALPITLSPGETKEFAHTLTEIPDNLYALSASMKLS